MKLHILLAALYSCCAFGLSAQTPTTLFSEDFGENIGSLDFRYIYEPTSSDRSIWAISGYSDTDPSNLSGYLSWSKAANTCSWVSSTVDVAGYTSLSLEVGIIESGGFDGTDSLNVIIIEDGVERVVQSEVASNFESLSITEACTASVSLQVLIHIRTDGTLSDAIRIDDVKITGVYAFDDIDADGINDASDVCIDLDGDGTCDHEDSEIMLMNEDFSSYVTGDGLGDDIDGEAGIAYVEGYSAAGDAGWVLLGEEQKKGVKVASSGGTSYLEYNYTGTSWPNDITSQTLLSRCFDVSHITDPKVRFVGSEVTDFVNGDDTAGQLTFCLIEDGTRRAVYTVSGEFTSFDTTIASTAKSNLYIEIIGYAQGEAYLRLEQMKVFGGYCQTGKDVNGDCQDIGCTTPRACNYNSIAITHDETKCSYIGDSCDDGDATNFLDRYINAGDGTCSCTGYALQSIYLEDFSAFGEAQGGIGYGLEGTNDNNGNSVQNENLAALEPEWSLSFENTDVGTGTTITPGPTYFMTQIESGDTVMKSVNTYGDYIRWTTRTVDVSNFDSIYVSGNVAALGTQGSSDYIRMEWMDNGTVQTPSLAQITGTTASSSTSVNEKVTVASGSLKLQVEVESNVSGFNLAAGHTFDDIKVSGLKQGCTDPDASNYDASPSDGHVALSDDGSCQYDWATVYSRKDGEFDDELWAGKPCSEAGYTCGSSSQYIDIKSVTQNGTRHAVISANTQITVPAGNYTLGELTLENGAELVIAEGRTLTVNGAVHHQGGTISGTGRLIVKGEMEIASGVTSVDVHDFTFGVGGQLSLQNGDTLRVKGDLTIDDGSAIAGRIELAGTSAQTVSGLDVRFDTLRVNSSGVTMNADFQVDGLLDIDLGTVEMNGHTVTFASDAGGTGMLAKIPSGGSASLEDNSTGSLMAADAIVNRYIAPDDDGSTGWGYTLFGSPLVGATVGDLSEALDFTYSGVAGTATASAFSTILMWDEKNGIIEPNSANTPLDSLGGCWITLLGNQTPTMRSTGELRSHVEGSFTSLNLTRTPGTSYEGWNLMFNPFQAMLDWNEVADYSTNAGVIEDQFAIYDTQTREFKQYSESNGVYASGPRYIMPGQGFWVRMNHATDTTGTLKVPASAINVTATGVDFVRSEQEGIEATLMLEVENAFGADRMSVQIGNAGSLEYNRNLDLSYLGSSSILKARMAVLSEGGWPCVSKVLPREAQAELMVKSRSNWETTIRVVDFTEGADVCVTITDTETGEVLVSRIGDEMTFTMPMNTAAEGRFVLNVVPSATVAARPPSCPEMLDGRVEVALPDEPTNVLLTDGGDNVLDQIIGATGVASFEGLEPGDYGLVVAGPGMLCGTERRSFTVAPGEQPELLGLDWDVPACNAGEVTLDFELYGNGDFASSLRLGNTAVWTSMEQGGEVSLTGLQPGTYALEVDHVCLEETVVLDLFDADAVAAEAVYDAMVVLDPTGGTALEAFSACVGEEEYRWVIDGEIVGQNEPLFHPVDVTGGHVVELEAWNSTCSDIVELPFLVVNWNEARVLDAPVTVREDASHWTLVFGRELGRTELQMTDAAGRTVWSAQVQADEGFVHRVERPDVAGTYFMQVTGNGGQWGFPLLNAGF